MRKPPRAEPLKLSWEEIGFLAQGLSFSSRPMKHAIRNVTNEHSLGPRGGWILILISTGQVVFPLDITNVFRVGRSLITAELNRLAEARLITYRKNGGDRRRVELALTPLGEKACARVRDELAKLIVQRFAGYSREDVLLCARMLHDYCAPEPDSIRSRPDIGRQTAPGRRSARASS
jgi:DNA-binding MarR family transcriptional regulator